MYRHLRHSHFPQYQGPLADTLAWYDLDTAVFIISGELLRATMHSTATHATKLVLATQLRCTLKGTFGTQEALQHV